MDSALLYGARILRMFAYGLLATVLVLYLAELGLSAAQAGALLSMTLLGDTAIALWLTTHADRWGRRRVLLAGAILMILAGALFALTRSYLALLIAATIGVLSPSGAEVGPFLAIEQAMLAQITPGDRRTQRFAWYNLAGSLATALGALAAGTLAQALQDRGAARLESYRTIVVVYAALGVVLGAVFLLLSPVVEPPVPAGPAPTPRRLGLHRSRGVVLRLAALFSLDAFAGGFVVQSVVAYWFHLRFGAAPALLGQIFFATNLLSGLSALLAARIAARVGLLRTMVFTHLPSNLLLMLVPLMPGPALAIAFLLLRSSISQMDVPTRQSYTMAVVDPDERSAAAGVTGTARTLGAALAPVFAVSLVGSVALASVPFLVAGGLKVVYDLLLYRGFRALRPPEESPS